MPNLNLSCLPPDVANKRIIDACEHFIGRAAINRKNLLKTGVGRDVVMAQDLGL